MKTLPELADNPYIVGLGDHLSEGEVARKLVKQPSWSPENKRLSPSRPHGAIGVKTPFPAAADAPALTWCQCCGCDAVVPLAFRTACEDAAEPENGPTAHSLTTHRRRAEQQSWRNRRGRPRLAGGQRHTDTID